MQINSASSFTPNTALNIGGDQQTRVNEQRDRLVVQQEQEKARQKNSQNTQQNNPSERLDIDPAAIELVEQNQQLNADTHARQDQATQSQRAGYDQPSQQNITAVSAYQSVGGIAQRDSIQETFGVDLYA
ncbi:hypothetical protein Q4493_15095 [Colwellia sp. 1_MG-2023]|uniref:hypothetical protein n=1 Tax=Colwellia sp. 1_MG-2023 TaxID=3062649 RepID=UPI0026E48A62|nr:hypothetical protein [Colwellia sp. 1_MG-2023]MDO6447096.1 hypothetical protein [Colwellia sp. 1_MG-2023]